MWGESCLLYGTFTFFLFSCIPCNDAEAKQLLSVLFRPNTFQKLGGEAESKVIVEWKREWRKKPEIIVSYDYDYYV